jgi:hypothetical protein
MVKRFSQIIWPVNFELLILTSQFNQLVKKQKKQQLNCLQSNG